MASASRDGTVQFWNLDGASSEPSPPSPILSSQGISCIALSWRHERLLTPNDDNLEMFDVRSGERLWTLEGHSEPVRFVTMDWSHMRALSVSQDNIVKVWDLHSHECILTLERPNIEPIRTVRVRWEAMQAMAILYDGSVALWDFRSVDAQYETLPLGRTVRTAVVM